MSRRFALVILAGLALSAAFLVPVRAPADEPVAPVVPRDPRAWALARLAAAAPQGDAGDPYSSTFVRRHVTTPGKAVDVFLVDEPARELALAETFRREGFVREALAHYGNLIAFHAETPEGVAAAAAWEDCRREGVLGRVGAEAVVVEDERGERFVAGVPAGASEFERRVGRGDRALAIRAIEGPALERGVPTGRARAVGLVDEEGWIHSGDLEIDAEVPSGAAFYRLPADARSIGDAERRTKLAVVRQVQADLGGEPDRAVAEALLYLGEREEALDLYGRLGLALPACEEAFGPDRAWDRAVAGVASLSVEVGALTTRKASVSLAVETRNVRCLEIDLRRVLESPPTEEAALVAWLDRPPTAFQVDDEPAHRRSVETTDSRATLEVPLPGPGTWLLCVEGGGLVHGIVLCRTDASFEALAFPARMTIVGPGAGWTISAGAALGTTDGEGLLDLAGIPGGKCVEHRECCASCESCAHHHDGQAIPATGRVLAVGPGQFLRGTFAIDRKPLEGIALPKAGPTVLVYTDRPAYRAGDTLHFRGIVRVPREPLERGSPDRDLPAGDQEVVVELKKKSGTVLVRKVLRTGERGTFSGDFVLPLAASRTEHVLSAGYGSSAAEQTFEVLDYRKTDFAILLSPDPRGVRVDAGYVWGAPVEGAVVRCTVDGRAAKLSGGVLAASDGQRLEIELVRAGEVLATKSIVHRVSAASGPARAADEAPAAESTAQAAAPAGEEEATPASGPALAIRADREVYGAGDEIVLAVEGPDGADAIVAIGDVALYDFRRVRLAGGRAEARFPARGIHDPGAAAFAICRGRIARTDLAVRTRWMDVAVEAPVQGRPGQEVEVRLRSRPDAAFSLAAVDEAIYAIAEERAPDLYRTFHPPRPAAMSWTAMADAGFEGRVRKAEQPIEDARFRPASVDADRWYRGTSAVGGGFGGRFGGRQNLVARGGGSAASASAVNASLAGLGRLVNGDGSWSAALDTEAGRLGDAGATGLSLLAYLGAGHTHQSGSHKEVVRAGLAWLRSRQDDAGRFGGSPADQASAALALSEAWGLSRSALLQEPASRAVAALVAMQDPDGGWGSLPATSLAVLALKSARISELPVSMTATEKAARYVEARFRSADLEDGTWTRAEVAGSALALLYLRGDRSDPDVRRGLGRLLRELPDAARPDHLGWYLGTLVAFQAGGETWKVWNGSLKQALISSESAGVWTVGGETVCHTALAGLSLEIYYRYERAFGGSGPGEAIEPLAPPARVRVHFPDTAFWAPELVIGADGSAAARFHLPDSITTVRLTARGVTRDGAVGEARARIAVRQGFFVQIHAPAFLVEGDRAEVRLEVHDETGAAGRATVELEGYEPRVLETVPGRPATAVYAVTASTRGSLRLVARAASGDRADAMERVVPVLPPGLSRTVGLRAAGATGGSAPFVAPAGTRSARVSIHPERGSLTKVLDALRYLHGYPYG